MKAAQFWDNVDQRAADECWAWMAGQNGDGRGRLLFNGRPQYAYRVAWGLTHGEPIPDDKLACHRCDNPTCVNPSHIFIGTHVDNGRDAGVKGRMSGWSRPSGLEHHAATTPPEVIAAAVSEYLAGGERQEDVAARYGIGQSTLSAWMRGESRPDSGLTPTRKLKPCGTRAAYERHRRNGEPPCAECRQADIDNQRARRAKRTGAAA